MQVRSCRFANLHATFQQLYPLPLIGSRSGEDRVKNRADKGWAVKRARPSKKVWCSGLGLCLEMSLVFDFGQGWRCGLYIRHCRCHWIVAAWFVFLHFFLVPLCWYAALSPRGKCCYFLRDDSTIELYFRSATRQCRWCNSNDYNIIICIVWQSNIFKLSILWTSLTLLNYCCK